MNSLTEELRQEEEERFESRDSGRQINYTISELYKAKECNSAVTGRVIGITDEYKLLIDLGNHIQGTVAQEEIEYNTDRNKGILSNCMMGRELKFNVKRIKKEGRGHKIELDRKSLQEKYLQEFLNTHTVGDDIVVKVAYIQDYGLFVDIGYGVIAFIHVNELGVARIYDIKNNLSKLDIIVARIMSIEGRTINLATKPVAESAQVASSNYSVGQEVVGQVCGVKDNMTFVALDVNLRAISLDVYSEYTPSINDVVKANIKELDTIKGRLVLTDMVKLEERFNWEDKFKKFI